MENPRMNSAELRPKSIQCRHTVLAPIDSNLEGTVLYLPQIRVRCATRCRIEAARQVFPSDESWSWRVLMEANTNADTRLAARIRIVVTQRRRPVDPTTGRGPIRFKLLEIDGTLMKNILCECCSAIQWRSSPPRERLFEGI